MVEPIRLGGHRRSVDIAGHIDHHIGGADLVVDAQLPARPVQQAHASMSANEPILDGHPSRPYMLPTREIFAIKQLFPLSGLSLHGGREEGTC